MSRPWRWWARHRAMHGVRSGAVRPASQHALHSLGGAGDCANLQRHLVRAGDRAKPISVSTLPCVRQAATGVFLPPCVHVSTFSDCRCKSGNPRVLTVV
jgi:hypothetical protein